WRIFNANANNSVTIETDSENQDNKYLRMRKTADANLAVYNSEELDVTGIVTIEARLKRTVESGGYNQFGMYGFNKRDFNSSNPTNSPNPVGTFAFSQGDIITHNVPGASTTVSFANFDTNQWNIVRLVVNLDTKTFDIYIDDMNEAKAYNQP